MCAAVAFHFKVVGYVIVKWQTTTFHEKQFLFMWNINTLVFVHENLFIYFLSVLLIFRWSWKLFTQFSSHALEFFMPLNMSLLKEDFDKMFLSKLWQESLKRLVAVPVIVLFWVKEKKINIYSIKLCMQSLQ